MFDKEYRRIILEQILSNIDQRYKAHIINYLSNQKKFKQCLDFGFDRSDIQMYNSLLEAFQQDKQMAIKSLIAWKSFTLKQSYYIILGISNQKQYYDGTLNVTFVRFNLKTSNLQQTIYQVYGRQKAIYYSLLKQRKNINYIYNFLRKRGMCLL